MPIICIQIELYIIYLITQESTLRYNTKLRKKKTNVRVLNLIFKYAIEIKIVDTACSIHGMVVYRELLTRCN